MIVNMIIKMNKTTNRKAKKMNNKKNKKIY